MEAAAEDPDPLARRAITEELQRLLACLGGSRRNGAAWSCSPTTTGSSREQLAPQFGTPANTIKTWLRRSLMQFRECMGS